jgi:hypothetical protein
MRRIAQSVGTVELPIVDAVDRRRKLFGECRVG